MTNLEKIINSSIDEIRQKMLSISKKAEENTLEFNTSTSYIREIKGIVNELGCQVVKGYFESRDENCNYILKEGKRYLLKGISARNIITTLGRINIKRNYYQHRSGGPCIIPLDMKLGVEEDTLMPDVKEIVLYSCAFNTPEETSRLLAKCSAIEIHSTQIKRAVKSTNAIIEKSDSEIIDNIRQKESEPESDILACSLDGVNVLLNQKGKKKGRPLERPVKEIQNTLSSYKNVMCGSVTHYKLSESKGKKEPIRVNTKYIGRMPEDCYPTFKQEFEKELKLYSSVPLAKLVITDAHKSITGYLNDNPAFKNYHRIIDFYHAAEHLSHLAEAIHGKSSEKGNKWYINYRNILKKEKSGVSKLIRSSEYHLKTQVLSKTRKKEALKHLNYFKRHKSSMKYNDYIERGWPIGSGIIEAACKSIVKQRMCRSGQRWSIEGGQAILNLRAIVKSERWDSFWNEFSREFYTKIAA